MWQLIFGNTVIENRKSSNNLTGMQQEIIKNAAINIRECSN